MRKFILASVMIFVTSPVLANWQIGSSSECFVKYNAKGYREYRYCGGGQSSCANKKQGAVARVEMHETGMIWQNDETDTWYVCCNAGPNSQGTYKTFDTTKFSTKGGNSSRPTYKENKTITLVGGGKCTYPAEYDACGTEISTPCTTPEDCTDGLIKRNGVCVKPCPDGSAFESPKSNACIKCDTTEYQGQKKDSSGPYYCVKCDSETELWDKETKDCVKKSNSDKVTHITPNAMSKCGLCDNNTVFTDCVKCYSKAVNDTDKDNCKELYKTQCFLQD